MTQKTQLRMVLSALLISTVSAIAQSDGSTSEVVERVTHSKNFEGNKICVSADRKLAVYCLRGTTGG
jgi:hypothetical protein